MIRVTNRGSRALGTGKNVNGVADTFLQNGPKDELATVDAYQGGLSSSSPKDYGTGECTDCATGSAASGGSGSASTSGSSSSLAERLNGSGGTSERVTATLWEALICGSLDPDPESDGNRRARMGRLALTMRSTGCSAEDLVDLLAVKGGRAGVNRDELQRRLNAALDNSIAVLDEEERETLIQAMADATGSDADVIRASMDASQSVAEMDSSRSREISTFSEFASQYTGVPELVQVFDLGAEVAILDSLLSKSLDLGLPQAWRAILDQIDDDELRTERALKTLRQSAILSDLGTVQDIVERSGASRALAQVPDLVPLILRFYSYGSKTPSTEYPAKRDELIATLNMVDSNWARKRRAGVWVDNLEPFTTASKHAIELLKQSDYAVSAMIAQPYHKTHYQTVARKYYPWAIDVAQSA